MNDGTLRRCPTCRQPWPEGAEFDLRSFGWLNGLPRNITPSNIDGIIHDGEHDQFLVLETKRQGEPLPEGQLRLLRGLANLPAVEVRVLTGTLSRLTSRIVGPAGLGDERPTTPREFLSGVARWLTTQRHAKVVDWKGAEHRGGVLHDGGVWYASNEEYERAVRQIGGL